MQMSSNTLWPVVQSTSSHELPHKSLLSVLYRLQMKTLSKFAICLSDQFLQHSPLMGQITQIVSQRLDFIQDARCVFNHQTP